jgi:antitoxin (DNA-binding transcriptional repressor) of toxin-antitoxin stability system
MKTMTATEAARNFSRLLDDLEHGGEEIVVIRNKQPVARLIPGTPRMNALQAMSNLYRTLDDAEGEAWLEDIRLADKSAAKEIRDPWE